MLLLKNDLLDIIQEDIDKEQKFLQECVELKVKTDSSEWKLSNLMYMQNYISRLEDITDLDEDKNLSFNNS